MGVSPGDVGVAVIDGDRRYVCANAVYAELLGLDARALPGRPIDDDSHPGRWVSQIGAALDRVRHGPGATFGLPGGPSAGEAACTVAVELSPGRGGTPMISIALSPVPDSGSDAGYLAAIVDSSSDAIIGKDLNGVITSWNSGARRLFGYEADEMVGASITRLIPDDRLDEEARILGKLRDGLRVEPFDTVRRTKDGRLIDVSVTASPIADASGRIIGASKVARDISERKTAQAALKRERDRAQRYLNTADVILLTLDLEGRVTLINRKGCELLGYAEPELRGRAWIETAIPARLRSEITGHFQNLIAGDLTVLERPVVTRTGEERLIEWHNTLLRDEAGTVVGTFSSGTDVTERSQALAALQTAEERMRFALESAEVGIWDMDYSTSTLTWSTTIQQHYGFVPGTFPGTFDAFVDRVHPDDRPGLLDTLRRAMQTGADFTTEHRVVWPDRTLRWLSGAGRILLGDDGQPVRGVGISMDITARRTLEAQYRQAQKMEAVGRLAGGVAHDFNNLLTAILGYCELLLDGLRPGDPIRCDIAEIQKAGESAAGLTRQLLAFSRKEIIEPCLLDLNTVVTDLRGMLGRLLGEDITIVLGLSPSPALVMADRGQMEQVLMNLAVNARDAMPTGGTLTIETAPVDLDEHYAARHFEVTPGAYIVLTVSDTGEGMTADVQAHLFEPFFTTKGVGKGTGLGLATVHGIVSQGGGSVGVYSELGEGTSFKVYLPQTERDALAAERRADPPRRIAGETRTVLVVEDAEGLRELTRRLLERLGYVVLLAGDAKEALRVCDEHASIDVVLTDVVMPGASGPDLTRDLAERRPGLKVIFMSGYTQEAIVQHGALKPGIAFLHKPFTSDALDRKLREVLDR